MRMKNFYDTAKATVMAANDEPVLMKDIIEAARSASEVFFRSGRKRIPAMDVNDLSQETFYRAMKGIARFDSRRASLKTWVSRIAEFFEHKKDPVKVVGKGQEVEINTFSSSFSAEQIDGAFFALQTEYRKIQAEFNKLKAEVDDRVAEANKQIANDRLDAMRLRLNAMKVERTRYDAQVKALKVVIPQNLREIYEKVNAVANAK